MNDPQKALNGFGEASALATISLEAYRAFQRSGKEFGSRSNIPEIAEDALWLATITGREEYHERATAVAWDFTETDVESLSSPDEYNFLIDRYHRMRAVLGTVDNDSEMAREHIQWLRDSASGGRYRDDYHKEYPTTLPLLNVLEAILDRDWERFREAFEEYLAALLRDNESSKLPIENPDARYFTIPIVGLLVLGYRRGLDLTTVDPQRLPDDVATVETHLLPEEVLPHDWPAVEHEPSDLAQQLTQKIADFEAQIDDEQAADTREDEPPFEVGGHLDSPAIDSPAPPDAETFHAYDEQRKSTGPLSGTYGQWLLSTIDDELHDPDRSRPSFRMSLPKKLLRRLGMVTAHSDDLYVVTTPRSVAFLTDFDPDAFGMLVKRPHGYSSGGVTRIDANEFWDAVRDVLTNTPHGAKLKIVGDASLKVVPHDEEDQADHTHLVEGAIPDSLPESTPAPGELQTFITEYTDRSDPWAWEAPPTTRALIGNSAWLHGWLKSRDYDHVRIRAGIRNDDGNAGEGLLAASAPDGSDLIARAGESHDPADEYLLGKDELDHIVWPLGGIQSQDALLREAFDPTDGRIESGSVGVVADATYDLEQLLDVFRDSVTKRLVKYLSFRSGGRLRIENADSDLDYYFLYEQSPVES